jgi:hypothetical protein
LEWFQSTCFVSFLHGEVQQCAWAFVVRRHDVRVRVSGVLLVSHVRKGFFTYSKPISLLSLINHHVFSSTMHDDDDNNLALQES